MRPRWASEHRTTDKVDTCSRGREREIIIRLTFGKRFTPTSLTNEIHLSINSEKCVWEHVWYSRKERNGVHTVCIYLIHN